MKKIITTNDAPNAVGSYSQAIKIDNNLYLSGQIGINPKINRLVSGVMEQTEQIMKNLYSILKSQNLSFLDVVKTEIFLDNIDDFNTVDKIYSTYFDGYFPARQAVGGLQLPKGALVEISMIAVFDN